MTVKHVVNTDLRWMEGWRRLPYKDTRGVLTIGCGRNLDAVGVRDSEIELMLSNDIDAAEAALDAKMPWWRQMPDGPQAALLNLTFNLGIGKMQFFYASLAALKRGDWPEARRHLQDSRWAKQVGAARVKRIMELLQ